MSVPQPRVSRFGWLSVTAWAALTAMGFLAAVVLHFPGGSDLPIFDLSAAVLGFVFGAISGVVTALFQLLVLKPWLRSPWQWLVANGVAWGLVHALNDGIGVHPQVAFALAALVVALTQTIALRHYLTKGKLWFPIAAISWFLGFQLGHMVFNGEDPGNLVAAGLVVGISTGIALYALLTPAHPPTTQKSAGST